VTQGGMARAALQSIRMKLLETPAFPPMAVLFWNRLLVQSLTPARVAPLSVERSRHAVGRFLGFAVFHRARLIRLN